MNSSPSRQSTSTLRPRIPRLISLEDGSGTEGRSLSPTPSHNNDDIVSFSSSRAASPIPSAHPSRGTSRNRAPPKPQTNITSNPIGQPRGFRAPSSGASSSVFSQSYWETSWSSIQGIASTFLGTELGDQQKSRTLPRRKNSASTASKFNLSTAAEQWGPAAGPEKHIARGSQEDRLARLQAKRREALLTANGNSSQDSLGRTKRRTSIGQETIRGPEDDLSDALVYLHHVQPGDTLAGLSIRYNCSQAVLRKANRLWPNDSIQIRRQAFLPVDACAVKGRKISSPMPTPVSQSSALDLLGDPIEDNSLTPTLAHPDWTIPSPKQSPDLNFSNSSLAISTTTNNSHDTENQPWTHDSWVKIDHIGEPVEIVRLPRRELAYFPPARRKSVSYTDSTPPRSPTINPSTSSINLSPSSNSNRHGKNHTHSPSSVSVTSAGANSSAAALFARSLQGPGGVGTLDHKARAPGPGRDKLNTLFESALPAAAAAINSGGNGASLGSGLQSGLGGGGLLLPRASFDSIASGSSSATAGGLGELGGRVEGWVRKLAVSKGGNKVGGPGGPGGNGVGRGDEIELLEGDMTGSGFLPGGCGDTDGASGGRTDSGMEREREREGSKTRSSARARAGSSTARDEEERLLMERFPARGRVFDEHKRR